MTELPPISKPACVDRPVPGLTMDVVMRNASIALLRAFNYKADHQAVKDAEVKLGACECRSCLGIYGQAVRAFNTKWRVPNEEQMGKNIDSYRACHGA